MPVDHLDHGPEAACTLYLESQPGTQANDLQQVGSNASEVSVRVKKCQRRQGFIDHHFDYRVLAQPLLFALGQLQFLTGQQTIAAGVPAPGNTIALTAGHGLQGSVDHLQQLPIVPVYGKAEAMGLRLAEVGHFNVLQMTLADHVMRRDRVPQKYICLPESHRVDGVLSGRIGMDDGLGVERLDLIQRQVVVHQAQAQTGKVPGQRAAVSLAGHQDRLVNCIGSGQQQLRVVGFKAV